MLVSTSTNLELARLQHTDEVLAVAVDIGGIPEELAIVVALIKDGESFVVRLRLAIEGALSYVSVGS